MFSLRHYHKDIAMATDVDVDMAMIMVIVIVMAMARVSVKVMVIAKNAPKCTKNTLSKSYSPLRK